MTDADEKGGNKTLLQRWQRCTGRQIIVNSNLQNSASHSDRLTITEPLKARQRQTIVRTGTQPENSSCFGFTHTASC